MKHTLVGDTVTVFDKKKGGETLRCVFHDGDNIPSHLVVKTGCAGGHVVSSPEDKVAVVEAPKRKVERPTASSENP